jgi:TonB family protein
MALSGNTRELSLADLIVVKVHDPGNHRLTLSGPAGDGLLLIEAGRIVHAVYGDLAPLDAAYVLVTEEGVDFELVSDAEITGHTLDLGAQELLMEAMRRLDEGILRRPKLPSIGLAAAGATGLREPPRPRSHEAKRSPEADALRRATGRVLFTDHDAAAIHEKSKAPKVIAVVVGVSLLAAGALAAWLGGWVSAEAQRDPVDIIDLAGPRDILPVLLSGAPALAPDSSATFLPTIVCSLVVDPQGSVVDADIYQPRAGLDAFQNAAVAAVKGYRFTPARREGVPVTVKLNWPVDFIRARSVGDPVPVESRYFKHDRVGDALPSLVEGEPPATPFPERRQRPGIVCRILVDVNGAVIEAEVLSPTPELELYERVAIDAVLEYRFSPGEREGVPVPTWLEWTVEFR